MVYFKVIIVEYVGVEELLELPDGSIVLLALLSAELLDELFLGVSFSGALAASSGLAS